MTAKAERLNKSVFGKMITINAAESSEQSVQVFPEKCIMFMKETKQNKRSEHSLSDARFASPRVIHIDSRQVQVQI